MVLAFSYSLYDETLYLIFLLRMGRESLLMKLMKMLGMMLEIPIIIMITIAIFIFMSYIKFYH